MSNCLSEKDAFSPDKPILNFYQNPKYTGPTITLLTYLHKKLGFNYEHLSKIQFEYYEDNDNYLEISIESMYDLGVFNNNSSNEQVELSLFKFLDQCQTRMGSRYLSRLLCFPPSKCNEIQELQTLTKELSTKSDFIKGNYEFITIFRGI